MNKSIRYLIWTIPLFLAVLSVVYSVNVDVISVSDDVSWYNPWGVLDKTLVQDRVENELYTLKNQSSTNKSDSIENYVFVLDLTASSINSSLAGITLPLREALSKDIDKDATKIDADLRNLLVMSMIKIITSINPGEDSRISIILVKANEEVGYYERRNRHGWIDLTEFEESIETGNPSIFDDLADEKISTKSKGYYTNLHKALKKLNLLFEDVDENVISNYAKPTVITIVSDLYHEKAAIPLNDLEDEIKRLGGRDFVKRVNLLRFPVSSIADSRKNNALDFGFENRKANRLLKAFNTNFDRRLTETLVSDLISKSKDKGWNVILKSLLSTDITADEPLNVQYKKNGVNTSTEFMIALDSITNTDSQQLLVELVLKSNNNGFITKGLRYSPRYSNQSFDSYDSDLLVPGLPIILDIKGVSHINFNLEDVNAFSSGNASIRFYKVGDESNSVIPIRLIPLFDDSSFIVLLMSHFNFICVIWSFLLTIFLAFFRKIVKGRSVEGYYSVIAVSLIALLIIWSGYRCFEIVDFLKGSYNKKAIILSTMVFFSVCIFNWWEDEIHLPERPEEK